MSSVSYEILTLHLLGATKWVINMCEINANLDEGKYCVGVWIVFYM